MTQVTLTQRSTKQRTADALLAIKRHFNWSNVDMAEAMGCSEGTVRNRLDDDTASEQMTVHEVRRLLALGDDKVAAAISKMLEVAA